MRRLYIMGILLAIISSLALASCITVQPASPPSQQPYPYKPGSQQPYPYRPDGRMGPGMMGPGGMMGAGGMMGPSMMSGMPMMKGMMGYYSRVPAPLSHSNAKAIAGQYLASMNNPDLEIDEFEEYSHNFYVSLIEKSTGRGAIEIIIDRYSGSFQPEPQSMMWNSKYGKYGMMGQSQTAEMVVTSEQALKTARDFLDIAFPGTEADEIVSYYGYHTIMTTLEGEHYGMLSVNSYSGEVWYHTWHGMFISEVEGFHEESKGGH